MSECEETLWGSSYVATSMSRNARDTYTASLFSSMGRERCSRTRERGTRVVCTTKHVAIIHSVDLSRESKIKKDVFRTASKTELFRCIIVHLTRIFASNTKPVHVPVVARNISPC
ncbi:hypothetical protein PISMIDRAFT_360591 [Pisolithus microcarpus 441]|uniref:Uncharacterized protein n=1 Tax=Pisolithus microcarpus 441 TaxID=765257 RepID=A0A0C9ZS21_9AGAM|nr:hypothetical protein PISMIDRAFT_360591 [Pisolithus microcarpus 441]